MELEQTTLNQYFTTRRKGLEGVHPAKRRKVENSEDFYSENAGMRTRSKTRKQASISQTKASRSGKATNCFVVKSGNEVSFQPSCDNGARAISQPTSLLDDHAFAEALFGQLEAANRKRKMASLGQTENSSENVCDKGNAAGAERQREKIGVKHLTKKNATTCRKAKETKPSRKESKETDKDLRKTAEESRNSSSPVVESATQHVIEQSSTNEVTASPQKTPPVVRRVASGVGTNPWIAEQARAVLSRGRTAVNLSQNPKNRSREKQQATLKESADYMYNQLEGQVVAKSNVNKAQEDLIKARKLIEAMRSLEKGASKPTQLLTKDNSQRLHEVASSKPRKGREQLKSAKDVPAYERFHALAQASPEEVSPATLSLPYKYKALAEMFRCTDTVLNLLGQRKETCTFAKLRDAVQQMSRKRFEKKHLSQMKSIYPSAFDFYQDKCLGKSAEFELTVQFGRMDSCHPKLTLTGAELLARKDTFQKNLLALTKKHHQEFLFSLNPSISIDNEKLLRWHPKFHLDDVPDIAEAPLPQPPVVKTYSTAHDVLEKARDMIAPRVDKALRNVAKETERKEQETVKKDKNMMENKDTANTENTQNKNNSRNKQVLKGISQDLLNKIRQKEAKKIEETMMRDPVLDKKLAMRERLPDLCRILKVYFSSERKAAIPLEDATVKLAESYKSSLSAGQVEEHLKLASQLVPEWMSILTVRKCSYIKINKMADVNNVINKLVTIEIN